MIHHFWIGNNLIDGPTAVLMGDGSRLIKVRVADGGHLVVHADLMDAHGRTIAQLRGNAAHVMSDRVTVSQTPNHVQVQYDGAVVLELAGSVVDDEVTVTLRQASLQGQYGRRFVVDGDDGDLQVYSAAGHLMLTVRNCRFNVPIVLDAADVGALGDTAVVAADDCIVVTDAARDAVIEFREFGPRRATSLTAVSAESAR